MCVQNQKEVVFLSIYKTTSTWPSISPLTSNQKQVIHHPWRVQTHKDLLYVSKSSSCEKINFVQHWVCLFLFVVLSCHLFLEWNLMPAQAKKTKRCWIEKWTIVIDSAKQHDAQVILTSFQRLAKKSSRFAYSKKLNHY